MRYIINPLSASLQNIHKGNVHFQLEEARQPSRFLTLKALKILGYAAGMMGNTVWIQ